MSAAATKAQSGLELECGMCGQRTAADSGRREARDGGATAGRSGRHASGLPRGSIGIVA